MLPPVHADLFQPSLSADRPVRRLYSSTACWMSAFFGGIVAGALMFGINAVRAGRMRQELPWIIGGVILGAIALVASMRLLASGQSADTFRLVHRVLSLSLAGVWHWRLRSQLRAQALFGGKSPDGILPALGAIAIGLPGIGWNGLSGALMDTSDPTDNVRRQLALARGWYERQRFDRALAAAHEGLRAGPTHFGSPRPLASTYFDEDELASAQATAILRDEPEDAAALLLLARIESDRGEHAHAEELLLALLREMPDSADLSSEYARLRLLLARIESDRGAHAHAEELLLALMREMPDSADLLSEYARLMLLLARIESDRGEHARAEELLLALLREMPDSADLLSEYARLMLKTLHLNKARALAAEALKREPNGEHPLMVATLCDIVAGKQFSDQRSLGELVQHFPHARTTTILLIAALMEAGKNTDAHRLSQELVRSDPRDRHAVSLARQFAYARHWTLLPLWPVQRFGWGGVVGTWLLIVVLMRALPPSVATPVAFTYLGYCIYSWVWQCLLRRWMFGKSQF